jgi:hypothetical protein
MKRSGPGPSPSRPDPARFVLDEGLSGVSILEGLRAAGIEAMAFGELFRCGMSDVEILDRHGS